MPTAEELGAPKTVTTIELRKFCEAWARRKKLVRWEVCNEQGCFFMGETPIDWDRATIIWKSGNVYEKDPTDRLAILYLKQSDDLWELDEGPQVYLTPKGAKLLEKE